MDRGNIQFVFLTVESISSVTSNDLPYQGEIWLASVMTTMTTVTKMPMTITVIMWHSVLTRGALGEVVSLTKPMIESGLGGLDRLCASVITLFASHFENNRSISDIYRYI